MDIYSVQSEDTGCYKCSVDEQRIASEARLTIIKQMQKGEVEVDTGGGTTKKKKVLKKRTKSDLEDSKKVGAEETKQQERDEGEEERYLFSQFTKLFRGFSRFAKTNRAVISMHSPGC